MAFDRTREPAAQASRVAALQAFTGTPGNDSFTGTAANDTADLSRGGDDIFRGLGGDDGVYMGAAFTARDRINGGNGLDYLDLDGDYSAGVTFGATTISGIDEIGLYAGHSYKLTLNDGNVAALGALAIFALSPGTTDAMVIDGSAETNGDLLIYGGAANDTLIGGAGNDLFRSGGGVDTIAGGAGIDRISYVNATAGVTLNLNRDGAAQDTGFGTLTMTGIEAVSGTTFADVLTGDAGDNQFFGGGGNDRINGAGGDDWLIVGAGYDGALPTGATIAGGAGRDILDLFSNSFDTAGIDFDLAARGAQDTGQGVFTVSGIEDVAGTAFADTIAGNAFANALYGNAGDDRLIGGNGDDALFGDGYLGTDRPSRTNGPPTVFDSGDRGADTLVAGAGADVLTGGAGGDVFDFDRLSDSSNAAPDRIADFGRGFDVIDVSTIDADTTRAGNQAFHLGATAGQAGDIVASYNAGAQVTTLAFHTDADGVADMTIRLDGDHTDLTSRDFVF